MRLFLLATVLLSAGCPAPRHALAIEVRSGGQPLASAVVALVCKPGGSALLTDEAGRASLEVRGEQPLEACRLLAGKPGFRTVESRPVPQCAGRERCSAAAMELELVGASSSEMRPSPGAP